MLLHGHEPVFFLAEHTSKYAAILESEQCSVVPGACAMNQVQDAQHRFSLSGSTSPNISNLAKAHMKDKLSAG